MAASIRIDSSHSRYDEVYTAWELNGYSGQFDMIVYDEDGDAEGGAIFHVLQQDDDVTFFQRASDRATVIPEPDDGSRIRPGWSFASIRYRGEYDLPSREGLPRLKYEKLPNRLVLE